MAITIPIHHHFIEAIFPSTSIHLFITNHKPQPPQFRSARALLPITASLLCHHHLHNQIQPKSPQSPNNHTTISQFTAKLAAENRKRRGEEENQPQQLNQRAQYTVPSHRARAHLRDLISTTPHHPSLNHHHCSGGDSVSIAGIICRRLQRRSQRLSPKLRRLQLHSRHRQNTPSTPSSPDPATAAHFISTGVVAVVAANPAPVSLHGAALSHGLHLYPLLC
jgi:hypothetical protein